MLARDQCYPVNSQGILEKYLHTSRYIQQRWPKPIISELGNQGRKGQWLAHARSHSEWVVQLELLGRWWRATCNCHQASPVTALIIPNWIDSLRQILFPGLFSQAVWDSINDFFFIVLAVDKGSTLVARQRVMYSGQLRGR